MSNDDPGLPHSTLIPRAKTVPDISSGDKKTASESWSLTQASSQGPSPRGVAGSSRSDALILPEITFDPRKGATLSRQSKSRGNFREISAMQGRSGDEDSTQDRVRKQLFSQNNFIDNRRQTQEIGLSLHLNELLHYSIAHYRACVTWREF